MPRSNAVARFFAQRKVGQKITVTGGFKRFPTRSKKQYLMRDLVTGDVEYMEYFGMTKVPTLVVAHDSVSTKGSLMDRALLVYYEQDQVKDLPLLAESFWFTGTLIGYPYGTRGVTRGMGVREDPYITEKCLSPAPGGSVYAAAKEKGQRMHLLKNKNSSASRQPWESH